MKNTVHNDATSSNLKGKPMTKTIGLRWLQQVTKHVPATDEASVHRAQLRVKTLSYRWTNAERVQRLSLRTRILHNILAIKLRNEIAFCVPIPIWYVCRVVPAFPGISRNEKIAGKVKSPCATFLWV